MHDEVGRDGATLSREFLVHDRAVLPQDLAAGLYQPDMHNLATLGALAADVERLQLPTATDLKPDVASVVVGINDTLRGDFDPQRTGAAVGRTVAALRAAGMEDAGWASGDPWLYGVWSLIRIGAGTAHVMNGDLDAAAGQLGAVTTLDPPFRIVTITGYLADMDSLLAQRRFASDRKAGEMREQIRVLTAAACPAAPATAPGREDR